MPSPGWGPSKRRLTPHRLSFTRLVSCLPAGNMCCQTPGGSLQRTSSRLCRQLLDVSAEWAAAENSEELMAHAVAAAAHRQNSVRPTGMPYCTMALQSQAPIRQPGCALPLPGLTRGVCCLLVAAHTSLSCHHSVHWWWFHWTHFVSVDCKPETRPCRCSAASAADELLKMAMSLPALLFLLLLLLRNQD
jgi:hypothetical protein